ncbi:hypothetical protein ACFL6I_07910 [candidate division KSB1 bacterium]
MIYKKNKKSQASLEIFTSIGIVIVIFLFMAFYAHSINMDKEQADEMSSAENLCLELSSVISGVYLAGPGTEFTKILEHKTSFQSEKGIFVKSENYETFCISGFGFTNGTDDDFTIGTGTATFTNENGFVVIRE